MRGKNLAKNNILNILNLINDLLYMWAIKNNKNIRCTSQQLIDIFRRCVVHLSADHPLASATRQSRQMVHSIDSNVDASQFTERSSMSDSAVFLVKPTRH
jgi:hypothetical protein